MANYDDVTELPEVKISTPPPALEGPGKFWTLGIGGKAETCAVVCIMVTIAGRKGAWTPVTVPDFCTMAEEDNTWSLYKHNPAQILIPLHQTGTIRLVRYQERIYIVPTQAMVDLVSAPGERPFTT